MKSFYSSTVQTIYQQGILPSVIYGIQVWGNCETNLLKDLEKVHLKAARFVKRISKKIPDCEVLSIARWNSISHYYKRSVAVKAYQIYNKISAPQLHHLITAKTGRATRNIYGVELPSFRYKRYKTSFSYRAAIIWNNLPNEIRNKPTKSSFKYALSQSNVLQEINFGVNETSKAKYPSDFIYF